MTEPPRALSAATMCEAFQITAAERPESPALRLKDSDYEASFADYATAVRRRAGGFAALGVKRGDTVGFMLVNRPAFFLTDCAAMHLGATCFSVYNTSSPEQVEYLAADAANRVIVTEQAFLGRVLEARERVDTLEHVIVVDGEAPAGTISLAELEALAEPEFDFEAAWRAVEPDPPRRAGRRARAGRSSTTSGACCRRSARRPSCSPPPAGSTTASTPPRSTRPRSPGSRATWRCARSCGGRWPPSSPCPTNRSRSRSTP